EDHAAHILGDAGRRKEHFAVGAPVLLGALDRDRVEAFLACARALVGGEQSLARRDHRARGFSHQFRVHCLVSGYDLLCSRTFTIFMVLVPPDLPMGSPMVSTMRSPGFTTPLATSTLSASASSSSRSWPTYFTISG